MVTPTLTEKQIRIALAIQTDLDKHGSALLPSSALRDIFGTDVSTQVWLCVSNCWMPVYDRVLDLTRITQTEGERPCPIEEVAAQRRKVQ